MNFYICNRKYFSVQWEITNGNKKSIARMMIDDTVLHDVMMTVFCH